jgi:hypothetical protein
VADAAEPIVVAVIAAIGDLSRLVVSVVKPIY